MLPVLSLALDEISNVSLRISNLKPVLILFRGLKIYVSGRNGKKMKVFQAPGKNKQI